MKEALQQLISKMPSINIGLSHPELITDITWLNLTHSEGGKKFVYIFRSLQKEMMVAHNGHITSGEWDFFSNSNSLALIYQGNSYLYNALLVDNCYLVLKQDAYQEGMLFINQAHFIALLEQYGKEAMKKVYTDIKALANKEWIKKPTTKPEPPQKNEEHSTQKEAAIPQEKPVEPQEQHNAPLNIEPEQEKAEPIQPAPPIEKEEVKSDKGTDILSKYRSPSAEEPEEEEEAPTLFNSPAKETLNDKLKEQLKQEKQPSLLEKLQQEQKRK